MAENLNLNDLKVMESKRKVKFGYMWALFCAVFWGIWYLPGTAVWVLNPFDDMSAVIAADYGNSVSLVIVAVLITALNALTVVIALLFWNAILGKHKIKELGRTIMEFKHCSKWFFLGSICGLTAVFGSYLAMGFIGAAFSAVAGLLYPVVGSTVARLWYGEKISKRALAGILIIVCGGIAIYAGGLVSELATGNVQWFGYLGGLMAAVGWGLEGAVAGKGLDLAEPDSAITIRFIGESLVWWIIIIPILALFGFPMLHYALLALNPMVLLVLMFAGITFGFCYVTWYKSFPLIGVGRGQGIGNLYGLFAVIFVFLFFGSSPGWAIIVGGILCVIGSLLMFTESTGNVESLRGD
ncbi:DMT family transporter [Methanolapillus millepedarum]|uniref:EamA domain-containing protein n=1 Tax=Methanolapillus millepedarum TaxID=3028296 RepID=A0AA96V5P4_9EURY|nr:hypothetical protein MsAc7_10850 [Methanosarcinaceae archaeon Ac7]